MSVSIFVFGSNLAGRHGAGAALHARKYHGALYGNGEGIQGESYAIPTKNRQMNTCSLEYIQTNVDRFITFAITNQQLDFHVTKIGCGLAGYREEEIKPMFKDVPKNCKLPKGWRHANK